MHRAARCLAAQPRLVGGRWAPASWLGLLVGLTLAGACHGADGDRGHDSRPAGPAVGGAAAKDRPAPDPPPVTAESAAGEPATPELLAVIDPPNLPAGALAAWKPPATAAPEVAAILERILHGEATTKTLKELQKLTHKYPNNEELPYLMGQLYFTKLWVGDGLKSFRSAIKLNPLYRSNPFLLRAVISGLGNDSDHAQVRRFLAQDIGRPAAPYLEEVLYGEWRAQVKERAAAVLREVQ